MARPGLGLEARWSGIGAATLWGCALAVSGCTSPVLFAGDTASPDAGAGAADGSPGMDAGDQDAGDQDAGVGDASALDAPMLDSGPSGPPCADGTTDQVYLPDGMVGCNGNMDQCTAAALCGAGWHLCTYSEYASRGGATISPSTTRWIASCVRDVDCALAPAPTDAICSSCIPGNGPSVVVAARCGGGLPLNEATCGLGVWAAPDMETLLSETTCLYARAQSADRARGATCCR